MQRLDEAAREELRLGLLGPTAARSLVQLPVGNQLEVLGCARREGLTTAELRGVAGLVAALLDQLARMETWLRQRTRPARNNQWRRVVEELTDLASEASPESKVWTEIAYLQKHGEAGRLKYPTFRNWGMPLGSGSIESASVG